MKISFGLAGLVIATLLVGSTEARSEKEKETDMETMSYNAELQVGFDEAIDRVTAALKAEQFGVISRIDLHATFKEKLGVDMPPHTILGACNPKLAHKAVSSSPEASLMLPCNVTVQQVGENRVMVRIVSPEAVMSGAGLDKDPVIREVGLEADARLKRVAKALGGK
jgi:uncharacterized protein (DUF302 family)